MVGVESLALVHGIPLTDEPGLGSLTLPGYLQEITTRFADREAVVMHEADGVQRWSYTDLWQRSLAVARALIGIGVAKDTRVAVLMTNRPEFLSSVFGIAMAGGVAVMLSTFSTAIELEYLLKASSAAVLLFERRIVKKDFVAILKLLEPVIEQASPTGLESTKFPFLRHLAAVGISETDGAIESWQNFLAHAASTPPGLVAEIAASVCPTDTAALFFSSGSTARPKGILSAHRGIVIHLWRWRRIFNLSGDVRSWTPNGFFWSGNFGTVLGTTLSCGGALILQQTFIAHESLRVMADERVNFPMVWPHQGKQLEEADNWGDVDLSAMRFVDPATALGRHPSLTGLSYTEPKSYGSTETFTITTGYPSGTADEIAGDSHGEVLPGNTLKIVDPIDGHILQRNELGEIAVKGPTLMLGYLGVPNEDAFDDEGFFRTGDGGFVDDVGRLHFQGRLSSVIKTGGANVSPLEISAVLQSFPGVKVVATVGVPHETLGEMVVACIVPAQGAALDAAAIQAFARERLASYKVPRGVLFLREEEMALTATAKIKPGALKQLAIQKLQVLERTYGTT